MQVIQCLYKIGVCTFSPADFIELSCIGAVLSSYHDHHIGPGCKSPCRLLALLCRAAYSIHNTNIVTFFLKNFNYIMKFIVVKCRLRHDKEAVSLFRDKIFCLPGLLHHRCRPPAHSQNPLHLGMSRISHNDDVLSLCALLPDDPVDPLHKGTGGIHALQALLFQNAVNLLRHPVGSYDHGCLLLPLPGRKGQKRRFILQNLHASLRKLLYHHFIVYHRSIGVYSFPLFQLFIHGIHRPPDPETEACAFVQYNFHAYAPCPQIRTILSMTSSGVISEVSTSTASSACRSGDVSRCMSM